ncbi:MAG TPA: cupin domain-containing protein [Pirellulales bacterium]|nr:cupin domain-containing protein [Pirellulales bacterium]
MTQVAHVVFLLDIDGTPFAHSKAYSQSQSQIEERAMARPLAKPGEVVDVGLFGSAVGSAETMTLVKAKDVEVIRLIVPAGKLIAEHKAKGEIIVHCLEGRVEFTVFDKARTLEAGKLLYLPTGEPHSVKGLEDSSLLLTILLPKHE